MGISIKFAFLLLACISIASSLGTTSQSAFCNHSCSHLSAPKRPGLWETDEEFLKIFEPHQNILILSDSETLNASRRLAHLNPKKEVTGTDLSISRNPVYGELKDDLEHLKNFKGLEVDNQQRLPFESDQFDLVFMENGICRCGPRRMACGGIQRGVAPKLKFLREDFRVLNKRYPGSTILLHGEKIPLEDLQEWENAADQLKKETGAEWDFLRSRGHVRALRIFPKSP